MPRPRDANNNSGAQQQISSTDEVGQPQQRQRRRLKSAPSPSSSSGSSLVESLADCSMGPGCLEEAAEATISMGQPKQRDQPARRVPGAEPADQTRGLAVLPSGGQKDERQQQQQQQQLTLEPSSWSSACSLAELTDDTGLLYYSREPLRLKDFHAEVRAHMDVEQFAHQAELLLDVRDLSMEGIIEAMLAKVIESDSKGSKLSDIRDAIFVPGSSMLMARTIHGYSPIAEFEDRGKAARASLRHDQSWLCALCELAQVSKRHMVVARFKQPINMGENAHEVRLFVLIIVPTIEKSTKDQVETGRTFATMLAQADFRQELLEAASATEFKALMLVKARQLARSERLRNRHKYQLDAALQQSISASSLTDGGQLPRGASEFAASGPRPCGLRDLESFYAENPRTGKLFELIASSTPPPPPPPPEAQKDDGARDNGLQPPPVAANGRETARANGAAKQEKRPRELASNCFPAGCCASLWGQLEFGRGAWRDFKRRLRCYPSDFRDAFVGPPRTLQKTVATIWFLYFGILLPTIAFSSLNTHQTHGHMGDLRKAIIGQAVGGLVFALLGGQPIVIIMTTAPLCLYTKVVHQMCLDYGFHFPAMYAAVGLWNGLFLVAYSLLGFSKLMQWCTRSTEEIFALFIVVAFVTDAGKDLAKNFRRFYFTPACAAQNAQTSSVMTDKDQTMAMQSQHLIRDSNLTAHDSFRDIEHEIEGSICRRETSLLFILLMLGTLWLAVTLYKFRRTPYLSAGKRDILADYALPTAVILMSLVGSTIFDDIYVEKFPPLKEIRFERAPVENLPWTGILTSMGLGFTLSLLFFMDQNISAAMVNAPQNKLKKGAAYHYDLLIVGLLNGALSLFGLPMMHGVLPHSPLHARSLADIEEQVDEGHLRQVVVNCRETRVTSIVAHVLVLGSLLLIPEPIAYIPRAVLNGLFLYMAITSLDGLQVFERILLLVTEQSKYPPNHYIRRCPQRKIHAFTLLQLAQLAVLCLFGFSPLNIVEMFFPLIILLMIPFRHKVVPKYIDEKYLDALDGKQ